MPRKSSIFRTIRTSKWSIEAVIAGNSQLCHDSFTPSFVEVVWLNIRDRHRGQWQRDCKRPLLCLFWNGLPFRLIEDDRLKLIPLPASRERLMGLSDLTAVGTFSLVEKMLSSSSFRTETMQLFSTRENARHRPVALNRVERAPFIRPTIQRISGTICKHVTLVPKY